jgi:hypothetical protein
MSAIISTLGGENRLILDNSRFARQPFFMINSTWQKLRIGMRLCLADSGSDVSSCSLHIGICTGDTNIFGDSGVSPTHFFGANMVGNFNTFVRATGPTRYGCSFGAAEEWGNGVLLIGTGGGGDLEPNTWNIGATDSNRTLFFVDIIKGNPDWHIQLFRNTDTACTDVDKATFDAQVVNEVATLAGHSFTPLNDWGIMRESTYGVFDHVNINWNHTNPVFKISDLAVVQFA